MVHLLRRVGGVHRQGVHCDFCHKIADVRSDRVGLDHTLVAFIHPKSTGRVLIELVEEDA